MRAKLAFPALIFSVGMTVGVLLWVSGLDLALQKLLLVKYDHSFNQYMRFLGELGMGRTLVWGCLITGIVWSWQGRGKSKEPGWRFVARLVWGVVDQLLVWVRGKAQWTGQWQGIARGPRVVLMTICVMAMNGAVQTALKMLVGRPRPKEIFWNGYDPMAFYPLSTDAGFWSFPSGHSASAFAVGVWLALVFPRYKWLFLSLAGVAAASRVLAVTPHFLGDIVAGAGLGTATAMAIYIVMEKAGGMKRA